MPGQLQSRDLGKWLRQRYVKELAYLSPEYQVQDTLVLVSKLLCFPIMNSLCSSFSKGSACYTAAC